MHVRAGQILYYAPNLMDFVDGRTDLKTGEAVKVVSKHGCPPPNTMGHCHVERLDGSFAGLVHTNSLHTEEDMKASGTPYVKAKRPKPATLKELAAIMRGGSLSYNAEMKREFERKGLSALRGLAKKMGFRESKVSFNAGGIAVSGDLYLRGMFEDGTGVSLSVTQGSLEQFAGYCRRISRLDDYSGGTNNWIRHEELADPDRLKNTLLMVARGGSHLS